MLVVVVLDDFPIPGAVGFEKVPKASNRAVARVDGAALILVEPDVSLCVLDVAGVVGRLEVPRGHTDGFNTDSAKVRVP